MIIRKRNGYLLFEVVIAIGIVAILASFVGSCFVMVAKDNKRIRAEKEIYEAALDMENIIKINVKKSNSLSQILFNDIIIKDFEIDREYEADAIAFDRTEKSTQTATSYKRFVISKQVWIGTNTKKSLWFINGRDDQDITKEYINRAAKYETGNHIKALHIKKLDEVSYIMRLELELNGALCDYSFAVKTV